MVICFFSVISLLPWAVDVDPFVWINYQVTQKAFFYTKTIITDFEPLHHGERSGWGFSPRICGKVITEESGTYRFITSSIKMEVNAIIAAVMWLCDTSVTRAITVTDSQSVLTLATTTS